jgi:hypothetical protein
MFMGCVGFYHVPSLISRLLMFEYAILVFFTIPPALDELLACLIH